MSPPMAAFDNGPATFDYTPPAALLTGRTAIVTGANVGLGLETAIHLGKLDPKLIILAVRDVVKGEVAKAVISEKSGLAAERIEVWALDQANFDSVKAFAGKAKTTLIRLDVLCLNAGIAGGQWNVTPDGWEAMLQVNGLSTGLLALELVPLLAATNKLPLEDGMKPFVSHLDIVGSDAHARYAHVAPPSGVPLLEAFNDKDSPSTANMGARYPFSKLLSLFLSRKIATLDVVRASGVLVNVSNPAMCRTELSRNAPADFRKFTQTMGKDPVEGAKNILLGCVGDIGGGAYISNIVKAEPSEFSLSEEGLAFEAGLWKEMSELWVGLDPELKAVLA